MTDQYLISDALESTLDQFRTQPLLFGLNIQIPFGKYESQTLETIPLKYLDETICVMPPTWLIRTTRSFVDACMQIAFEELELTQVPQTSWHGLRREILAATGRELPSGGCA